VKSLREADGGLGSSVLKPTVEFLALQTEFERLHVAVFKIGLFISDCVARLRIVRWAFRYLVQVLLLLATLITSGTVGFMIFEDLPPSEALHLTIQTITTVGYGDPQIQTPEGRMFSNFLMIFGVGIALYIFWAVMDVSVGTQIRKALGMRSYKREIGRMRNHVILCGHGRVGEATGEQLRAKGKEYVVIDKLEENLESLPEMIPRILGDATEDETLKKAGIDRARAVLIAFGDDSDTILCIVTCRALNPKLKIFARSSHPENIGKMKKVGANKVISPAWEGGRRLVHYVIEGSTEKK
jgi:voltage-gated potassium channel